MKYGLKYLRAWALLKRKSLYKYIYKTDEQYTPFAIVCTSRTGSTWLHTLLNSHPHIISHGEIINRYHKQGKSPELEQLVFHKYPKPIKAVGLKIFYGDESTQYNKYLEDVLKNTEIKIIHLKRSNMLAQYTSLKISERSWEWSSKSNSGESPIVLNLDDFQKFRTQRKLVIDAIEKQFRDHQVIYVSYEDLVNNHVQTLISIQEFLKVKPVKLFSALRRQSSGKLKDRIENRADFAEELN